MKKLASALLLSAAISTPAFAADQGFYAAADLGSVSFSSASLQGTSFASPSSITVGGGYRFGQYSGVVLSAEVGYSMISDSKANFTNATVTAKSSAFAGYVVGTYAINNQYDVFGKLGFANTSTDLSGTGAGAGLTGSSSKTNLAFGLGGNYNLDKQVAIRAQYENLGKNDVTATGAGIAPATIGFGVSVVSVGVVYNF